MPQGLACQIYIEKNFTHNYYIELNSSLNIVFLNSIDIA